MFADISFITVSLYLLNIVLQHLPWSTQWVYTDKSGWQIAKNASKKTVLSAYEVLLATKLPQVAVGLSTLLERNYTYFLQLLCNIVS